MSDIEVIVGEEEAWYDGDLLESGLIPLSDGRKTIIDWDGYCSREYWKWEDAVKCYLLASNRGIKAVQFSDGEKDSFGPLTRICTIRFSDGNFERYVYG